MIRRSIFATVTASVLISSVASDAGAKSCDRRPAGHVIARSAFVVVARGPQRPYPRYVAVDRTTCHRIVLAYVRDAATVNHVTAVGHFVAWYEAVPNEDGTFTPEVFVADARLLAPHEYGSYLGAAQFAPSDGVPTITDLVLTATGAMAWIGRQPAPAAELEVHYADYLTAAQQQPARLLDAGADVVPGSLALSANDIYWRRSDGPHTAPRAAS